jgi:hypothetical protein
MTTQEPNEQSPPPTPWEPPATGKPAAARSHMLIAWLVLALVVVIVVVGTTPFWAPAMATLLPWGQGTPAANGDAAAIRDLQARLDSDEAVLKQQAAQLSRLNGDAVAIKDQAARLAQLEARPAAPAEPTPALAPAPAPPVPAPPAQNPDSAAAIKALQDQVAKLTSNTAATDGRLAALAAEIQKAGTGDRADHALLLALANLRVAVEGSAPFTAELAAAQAMAGDNATLKTALAPLADEAKTGLPTTAALAERFDRGVAPAILRARGDTKNADWWQLIRARLENLVIIRRVAPGGPPPRDATEAAVVRAASALKVGDLAAAVTALGNLSGAEAKAAAPWLAQAKERVAAETNLAALWQNEIAKSGETKSEGRP